MNKSSYEGVKGIKRVPYLKFKKDATSIHQIAFEIHKELNGM